MYRWGSANFSLSTRSFISHKVSAIAILPSASVLHTNLEIYKKNCDEKFFFKFTSNSHTSSAGDHLVSYMAFFSNGISHHAKGCDDMNVFWLHCLNNLHESCDIWGSTFISAHSCHNSSSFDISPTSVVGNSFSDQHQRLSCSFSRLVLQKDDSSIMPRNNGSSAVYGLVEWITFSEC